MKAALLSDRGIVRLTGEDARSFLNGLITSDVGNLAVGEARFAALLTPQGKIVVDFFVLAAADGLLLDCPHALAAALAQKLGFYKLRAKVSVENLSDSYDVLALWDGETVAGAFADSRSPQMGQRIVIAHGSSADAAKKIGAELVDQRDYDAHRIVCGTAKGGLDFTYGNSFPHETNMDRNGGVDFSKGCYVGQEVVSRMQHRGTARTRIVRVGIEGTPPAGSEVTADGKPLGTMGSSAGPYGLALLRLDRVADALAMSQSITADGKVLRIDPADLQMPQKRTVA